MSLHAAIPIDDQVGDSEDDPRAVVADWLATLFVGPLTAAGLDSFESGTNAAALDFLDDGDNFRAGVASMRAALLSEHTPVALERQLSAAFTLLFDGPGGPNTVPTCASAYAGDSRNWFQDPHREMQALLRTHDLSVGAGCCEPADHIAVELAALAYLLRLGMVGAEDAARLVNHLREWVPAFGGLCAARDRSGFYAGAAVVLIALLDSEFTEIR